MPSESRAPRGIDGTRASSARVYDAALGGKDNYEADRRVVAALAEVAPRIGDVARSNRAWLERVVRHLAGRAGIDQFLDLGAGMPALANTHQIAQTENRDARIVYVDNDAVCSAHGRVMLERNAETVFIDSDITVPSAVLSDPALVRHLDLDRPVGLILTAVLHHLDDSLDPAGLVAEYVDALVPGSYVAINHFWDPGEGAPGHELAVELQRRFLDTGLGSGWFRSRERISEFFAGLELVEPGLVELGDWWPSGPPLRPRAPEERLILGGLAYKCPTVRSLR